MARLSPSWAVFNGHVNDAFAKAEKIFIANFGQEVWDKEIKPYREKGIMSIFDEKPGYYTTFYVTTVTLIVNGDVTA